MHHKAPGGERAACACTALRKASRAVTRLYEDAMNGTGISIIQFSILRNLARQESVPLMQLADRLVMERTTVYRALNPLRRRGWVTLGDADGRAKTATLTRRGRRALQEATGAWEAAQSSLVGRIGIEEWARIEASLAKLVAVAIGNTQ
jgi:DNA-binding MarR family transcriptional regulator